MGTTTFAERLAALLKERSISQRELAETVGVTEASMSRYMNGSRVPKSEVVANMATALHTTSDYLLGTEPPDLGDDFPKIKRLIARNSQTLTVEQKTELIKILISK